MKNILTITIGCTVTALLSGIASAQVVTNPEQTNPMPVLLNTIQNQQESIMSMINLQLLSAAIEMRDLPTMPMQTVNDQEALSDELGALASRLNNLTDVTNTLNETMVQETSLAAEAE